MKVKVKKLYSDAVLPKYGSQYSAGADLYAYSCDDELPSYCYDEEYDEIYDGYAGVVTIIAAGCTAYIHTGIAVELPEGTVGLIYARSGLACKQGLAPANKVGVIDSDYRGEIIVALHNHSNQPRTVNFGDRIAQLVIAPYYVAEFEEAKELSETVRGKGGFGSTGKN